MFNLYANPTRERLRKEKDKADLENQSTIRYNAECGECITVEISSAEKEMMIKNARRRNVILN